MSDGRPNLDAFTEAATKAYRNLMRHRDRYLKAWLAATGIHPAEAELVERYETDGSTVVEVRRKGPVVAREHYEEAIRQRDEARVAAASASLSGPPWVWQDDVGADDLDSMSDGMVLTMTAGTLRALISKSQIEACEHVLTGAELARKRRESLERLRSGEHLVDAAMAPTNGIALGADARAALTPPVEPRGHGDYCALLTNPERGECDCEPPVPPRPPTGEVGNCYREALEEMRGQGDVYQWAAILNRVLPPETQKGGA